VVEVGLGEVEVGGNSKLYERSDTCGDGLWDVTWKAGAIWGTDVPRYTTGVASQGLNSLE